MKPSRPALRYYGGKWRIAPWIVRHFPPHLSYVEPFCGGASVLLRKPPVRVEVLNDLDREIVSFFRTLRDRGPELVRAIELTPFARAEFELSATRDWSDPIEASRRVYVRCWQAYHSGLRLNRTGWRACRGSISRAQSAASDFAGVAHLPAIVARLKNVQLECSDALYVVDRYDSPSALFYVDPPYPRSARSHRWGRDGYAHEVDDLYHVALAERLRAISGMAIVSGYDCPLYDSLYGDWTAVRRDTRTIRCGKATETLWLSPKMAAALEAHSPTLWVGGEAMSRREPVSGDTGCPSNASPAEDHRGKAR